MLLLFPWISYGTRKSREAPDSMGTRLMAFYEDLLDIAQHSTFDEPTLYAAYMALVDLYCEGEAELETFLGFGFAVAGLTGFSEEQRTELEACYFWLTM